MSWNNGGWNGSPTAYQYTSLNPSGHLPDFERFIMTSRHQVTCNQSGAPSFFSGLFGLEVGNLHVLLRGFFAVLLSKLVSEHDSAS